MDCETLLAYLSDYIDHNLSENLSQAAQDHLQTCQNCRVVLDSTQRTIRLARQHSQTVIPAERRQALFTQIQRAFEKRL